MIYQGVEICCPVCKGELNNQRGINEVLVCITCERRYPVFWGIPDLRVFPDPYLSIEQDRATASKLAVKFDQVDFEGLLAYYYQDKKDVPANMIRQYTAGMLAGEARAAGVLHAFETLSEKALLKEASNVLDIGCGTAPLMMAAGRRGANMVGIDIGLRWLLIGKRRLADAHMEFPLICACAEALPFRDQDFGAVMSESTVENLKNQELALGESKRVLKDGGFLCLSTPNKFSLGPDPHTGILAGGYLPDRWTTAIVRRQGGIPPRRRLLSARSLSRIIAQAGFTPPQIALPDIPEGQRIHMGGGMRLAISLYHQAKRLPILSYILRWIGPVLLAVAQRPESH